MNVTIVSPFRDSAGQLGGYIKRIEALNYDPRHMRFVWVEGDSTDGTFDRLSEIREKDHRVLLVACDTGRPRHGSYVNAERFLVLATVFNAGLNVVDYDWSDWVLFLPSDIRYGPATLRRLVDRATQFRCDLLAPFVFQHGVFYDIWAFSRNGGGVGPFPYEAWQEWGDVPVPMTTVGGTLLMRSYVPGSGVRYTIEDVDRGLCHTAAAKGFGVWADPATHVFHGPVMSHEADSCT